MEHSNSKFSEVVESLKFILVHLNRLDFLLQKIAKSLKISLREWQVESIKKIIELIDRRNKMRQDDDKANVKAVYEKIRTHLEILEKRNWKSYASFRKKTDT